MSPRIDPNRIQLERTRRAWTQQHLAEVSGLGIRTVQRIEKTGTASPESIQAIAAAFDLSASELMIIPCERRSAAQRIGIRWPATAVAVLAVLTVSLLASAPFATARGLVLSMEAEVTAENDRYEHIGQMSLADGEESEFRMNGVFRILVTPTILDESRVSIALKIFVFSDGEYFLIGEPSLTTTLGREAVFQLGLKEDPASTIRVSVTPVVRSEA